MPFVYSCAECRARSEESHDHRVDAEDRRDEHRARRPRELLGPLMNSYSNGLFSVNAHA
ncbi:hypothetical protein ACIBUY_37825 [Streptomyces sp. NPDC050085]|uniref:hypothetical protein n=1 Tax=Streptomyces sp. NPDC050085 TaxID=3365600 RepID=UPI0037AD8FB6